MNFLLAILRPISKALLIKAVYSVGDNLQERLLKELNDKGPMAVSKAYDAAQSEMIELIEKARFVPDSFRRKAIDIVRNEGDVFQRNLIDRLQASGSAGLSLLIDRSQDMIATRIRSM